MVRQWTKIGLIIAGLTLLFLLDDLFVILILEQTFPKALSPSLLKIIILGAGILSLLLAWIVFKALRRRPTTGREGLIGEKGKALSTINGQGEVFVHGEIWKAMSEEEIQEGDVIEVTMVNGLALKVRKVKS
ncbi:MAG: NfeD family protein [Thermodesulfobacteriota bacterium]